MQIEVAVGPQIAADGGFPKLRGTRDSLGAQDTHARYMEAVYRGNVFKGANSLATPVTTQAGLSATTPAWTLFNPANSGKLLCLWRMSIGVNAAPAAATTIVLAANNVQLQAAPTATTLAIVTNAYIGNGNNTPVGQCYAIATLAAAPTQTLDYLGWIDAAANVSAASFVTEFAGDVIVGPGMYISVQSKTAVALYACGTWEEIPV